jgi:hypothetical protein
MFTVPLLVQICIVIVTAAVVAMVGMAVIAVIRFGGAMARLTTLAEASMAEGKRIGREIQDVLGSVRELLPPTQLVVNRFSRLGDRAADLSTAVFDEVEAPILNVVALARGVRFGAVHFVSLLKRRFALGSNSQPGDQENE